MTWLLGYLLVGFALSWVATQVARHTTDNGWRWELASTLLWPVTIVIAVAACVRQYRQRHRDHG